MFGQILRPARELDGVSALGQGKSLAVGAVDLGLKSKIRRQALGLGRIDPLLGIPDDEHRGDGVSVLVKHMEFHLAGGGAVAENIDLAAKAEVLRALSDIKRQLGLARPGIAAV